MATASKAKKTRKKSINDDLRKFIHIKGANSNNLKNIELKLPKNELIVVTGLSGSGKSSLIMDTLYAEGQRRYVESLSSYARQFLSRMKKPDVEFIKGICPAIAIEQKVSSSNARSTVGSLTEIYDYLRLLYARIGKTFSPVTGELVRKHEVADVVDFIFKHKKGTKVILSIPLQHKYERTLKQDLSLLIQKGYTRLKYEGALEYIEDILESSNEKLEQATLDVRDAYKILIDRFVVNDDEENRKRISDSVLTAFQESEGECEVEIMDGETVNFNNRFEMDGMTFLEPTHQLFNYNNPYGACPKCEGYGRVLGIDPNKVIPDDNRSVYDEAIAPWRGEKSGMWLKRLINVAHNFDFPIHRPFKELTKSEQKLIWTGNEYFEGLNDFFEELRQKTYKIQNRIILARFRGKTFCPECEGGRLRKEATYVKVDGKDITQLINLPLDEMKMFFDSINLSAHDQQIADRILLEVNNRLLVMNDVGLSYLTLDRASSTLSGGETQRINLTRTLGSNLTNSLYILDEPSVGLHPKDTEKLVVVLKKLRELGNTVVVVEHEEDVIRAADSIVDIGPKAGIYGGDLIYAGSYDKFVDGTVESLTSDYLTGKKEIPVPKNRRKGVNKVFIKGAGQHNLKDVDVTFPLNTFIVVSGVSGSGKTTLVKSILYPALKKHLGDPIPLSPGKHEKLSGDLSAFSQVELVNQNPLGKSSRSNPVTYVKAYDSIRKLYSSQQLSKIRGYQPKHFSFNVEGGRCETCKGEGEITVEMQFLSDVKLTCDECNGNKFKDEVLEVQYKGKSIYDILELSIDEAMEFFEDKNDIISKIKPLFDVGLGYVKLGQPSSTLSGGEAQRVKLASFLGKENSKNKIFFIFDEPTTGLHFHDILKLLDAMNALVEKGHTVLVVEHNLDVIKCADWLIDLGPTGGKLGGNLLYEGVPEGITKIKESFTGQFLKEKL
ncbi:MAG: excinuclease ABC subunit UvrA [Saprospiraceae bacterium]|nr:excinuclease ABC subunit UvrA [Saprospiraceae bacterium]